MGKLKCISIIVALCFVANLMNSCKVPEFILIKHKGEISDDKYKNKYYNIYSQASFFRHYETDTIRLRNIDLPLKLKQNLTNTNKSGSDVILRTHTKTHLIGDLFLVYNPFQGNLNDFSNQIVRDLKRLKINNIDFINSENIFRTDTLYSLVTEIPTDFIKNSKINTISYEIKSNRDTFSIIECHLSLNIKNNEHFLRVIYCVSIPKSIKRLDEPQFLKKQFRQEIYTWVACLDTTEINNKINGLKVDNLFSYSDSIARTNGIKAAYDSLKLLSDFYTLNNDFQSKSYYYQVLMTLSSACTDNLLSLKCESEAFPKNNDKTISLSEKILKKDAQQYIVNKYKNEPVIMFNEAHNRGQNRDFARKLLPDLYEKGFRYLAVETLDNRIRDSLISKRGYPILSSGYYSKESAYGQFIRDALNLGFKLVAYEDTTAYNPDISFIESANIREVGQANNLAAIFKKDKNAKIIVYAGYAHIEKRTDDKWIKMAEQLCKILNRNIPTIDCVFMKEGSEKKDEYEYYRAALDSFGFSQPIVLIENDTPFVHPSLKDKVDFNVFLPRTNYDLGYPDWLKETNDSYYTLKIPNNCEDAYLQVYKANEWGEVKKEAIPVMQFTLQKNRPEYKLYLRKGEYKVFISKDNKNILDDYFMVK